MEITSIISSDTITWVPERGAPKSIQRSETTLAQFRDLAEAGDVAGLEALFDPKAALVRLVDGISGFEFIGSSVVYNGRSLHPFLANRMLELAASGIDLTIWKKFVQRLYNNPGTSSREELYQFLEVGQLPLTPDGCFLAYKGVKDDYKDQWTGTIDNSVGQVVQMPREQVNDNRHETCSTGLHFCSLGYVTRGAYGVGSGSRIIVLKIDPADVVSIPNDYDNTKGRCCRYEVIGELERTPDGELRRIDGIVNTEFEAPLRDDVDGENLVFADDMIGDEVDPDAFKAPRKVQSRGVWNRDNLRKQAAALEIIGRGRMSRDQLLAAVLDATPRDKLRKLAAEHEIAGRGRMSADELRSALAAALSD